MKNTRRRLGAIGMLVSFVFVALLAACGGGNDDTPATSNTTLTGVAATGAALASANITVYDATGKSKSATADTAGKYTINVAGMTPPLLVVASDSSHKLTALVSTLSGNTITGNINQLTAQIATDVTGLAVQAQIDLFTSGKTSAITTTLITEKTKALVEKIKTALVAAGLNPETFDPASVTMKVGDAFDKILDKSPFAYDTDGKIALLASSLGADGWASASSSGTTTGGDGADTAHTYTVTNRNELILALYPDAVIATDGSFTSATGADSTKKIIYVKGTINLSMNKALVELTEADYKAAGYDFAAYVAAYKPSVWNAKTITAKPAKPSGTLEDLRETSSNNQAKIVKIALGSNTSLLGIGSNAKIIKGQLSIGDGVENVVIRNITFEDAFDYFPVWDPTDSFVLDTTKTGCQLTYVDANTGPQKCHGGRWNSDYDLITVSGGKRIWIDHCTFNDGSREDWTFPSVFTAPHVGVDYFIQHHDGSVDVTNKSNYVTISNSHFKNHDKTHLIGSSDTVSEANGYGALFVTLHHNRYENSGQRLPRVRMGKVHVYNNYYTGQIGYLGAYAPVDGTLVPNNRHLYGIGIGYLAKIYSENNIFEIKDAPEGNSAKVDDTVMFYTWHKAAPTSGIALGDNTYFYDAGTTLNGVAKDLFASANVLATSLSKPTLLSTPSVWTPSTNYSYTPDSVSAAKTKVLANAGAGKL